MCDGLLRLRGGGPEALPMDRRTGWAILFGATLFELVSTWFMNEAKGFTKPLESIGACVFYAASFYTFNVSLRALEISVAYAVWSAVVMAALAAIACSSRPRLRLRPSCTVRVAAAAHVSATPVVGDVRPPAGAARAPRRPRATGRARGRPADRPRLGR